MTIQEFSAEFDVLYNNIASNGAPGINEYEKSVFLTKAQDELIRAYFLKNTNKIQVGYDDNTLSQTNFSNLIVFKNIDTFTDAKYSDITNSKSIELPSDILFILNEQLKCVDLENKKKTLTIVPINSDAYSRLTSKPFNRPLKNQAWRLDVNVVEDDEINQCCDLIPTIGYTIQSYQIRYVKKPTPIILEDLEEISINGVYQHTECKLNPIIHQDILQRAVELAKASYTGDLSSIVALGQSSQTNIGTSTSKQAT